MIPYQLLEEECCVEYVDPHTDQCMIGLAWDRLWGGRLLRKTGDTTLLINPHHTKCAGLTDRHLKTGDRHIGRPLHMLGK